MKRVILVLMCLFSVFNINAQAPKSFKYQAIVRNSSGLISQNQNVSFRINLLTGSSTGPSVYEETHNVLTNEFGLVNMNIGEGNISNGNFNSINWGTNSYFIQTEFDEFGGSNFQLMGVSQLLSVPYALYSEKSGSADSSLWKENGNNIYYNKGNVGIGEITPTGKLVVKSDSTALTDDVIFSVLNAQGDTVLAVYQEGVRINVYDDPAKATGSKGGFAVGGFSPAKGAFTNEYLRVTPDSVRIYIEENSIAKATGSKGGFAVGGFSPAKSGILTNEYLRVTNDSTRIYTEDTIAGFSAKNILGTNKTSYLQLTPNNYFIGHEAGKSINGGKYNSFIGYQSGFKNTTGNKNYFIGYNSGYNNDNGYSNIFLGDNSGFNNLSGSSNIFLGDNCGYNNTTGGQNVFLGYYAGYSNNSFYNVFLGCASGYSNSSGWGNTANGYYSLFYNTDGYSNVANGYQSMYYNTVGNYNVSTGYQALFNNNNNYNVANGYQAMYSNTSGYQNTAQGYQAMYSNTTGYTNVAMGNTALYSNTDGFGNVAIGDQAMYSAVGTGNTAVGQWSLMQNAGNANTAIGLGSFFTWGSTNYLNSTALGYYAPISASDQVRVGNNSTTSIGGQVGWTTLSDKRFKKDIQENSLGLSFILKLRPVTYHLDIDKLSEFIHLPDSVRNKESEKIKSDALQTGFIAQEVEQAAQDLGFDFSGVDKPKNENDYYGLRYAEFTVPLVKAVQEQQTMIDSLKLKNEKIEKELITNKSQIETLKLNNESMRTEIENLKSLIYSSSKK